MAKVRGAATPALAVLDAAGVAYRVLEYAHDPRSTAFGTEAVEKLGLPAEAVFKTLLVDVGTATVTAVVPVGRQLDLKALASAVGAKGAQLLDPDVAQRVTGYVVGGRRGLSIGLAPADLVKAADADVAPIARQSSTADR